MDQSDAQQTPADDAQPDPSQLLQQQGTQLVNTLLSAIDQAGARLAQAAAGKPDFTSDHELKAVVELLKLLPQLLRHASGASGAPGPAKKDSPNRSDPSDPPAEPVRGGPGEPLYQTIIPGVCPVIDPEFRNERIEGGYKPTPGLSDEERYNEEFEFLLSRGHYSTREEGIANLKELIRLHQTQAPDPHPSEAPDPYIARCEAEEAAASAAAESQSAETHDPHSLSEGDHHVEPQPFIGPPRPPEGEDGPQCPKTPQSDQRNGRDRTHPGRPNAPGDAEKRHRPRFGG